MEIPFCVVFENEEKNRKTHPKIGSCPSIEASPGPGICRIGMLCVQKRYSNLIRAFKIIKKGLEIPIGSYSKIKIKTAKRVPGLARVRVYELLRGPEYVVLVFYACELDI